MALRHLPLEEKKIIIILRVFVKTLLHLLNYYYF
jgi:hypothetical protein